MTALEDMQQQLDSLHNEMLTLRSKLLALPRAERRERIATAIYPTVLSTMPGVQKLGDSAKAHPTVALSDELIEALDRREAADRSEQ